MSNVEKREEESIQEFEERISNMSMPEVTEGLLENKRCQSLLSIGFSMGLSVMSKKDIKNLEKLTKENEFFRCYFSFLSSLVLDKGGKDE